MIVFNLFIFIFFIADSLVLFLPPMARNLGILRRKSQNNKGIRRGTKRIMQQRQRQKKMLSKTDAGKFDTAL
jgi:hypothetical protein